MTEPTTVDAATTPRPRPLLAVVVTGDAHDDGLRGDLLSLAAAGLDVTVLAGCDARRRTATVLGDVRIERLPVRSALLDAWQTRRTRRRTWSPPLAFRTAADERAARARLESARLALAAAPNPRTAAPRVAVSAAVVAGRSLWGRGVRKAVRVAWRGVDRTVGRLTKPAAVVHDDDLEIAFGGVLDRLEPDAFLAVGADVAGVAARASARATLRGRPAPWVLDLRRAPAGDGPGALAARYRRDAAAVLEPAQASALAPAAVLGRVLGVELTPRPPAPLDVTERPAAPARVLGQGPLLGIGPANMAGQAWAWAKALERELPGVRTEVLMVDRGGPLQFPADLVVPTSTYGRDVAWQEDTRDRILSTWTHGLIEAGRPLMGVLNGRTFAADARLMQEVGITVGLVFHGSELRDPRRHAARHRWSPFQDVGDEWVQRVQATVDLVRPDIDAFEGPCLVSTPDLLEYLPRASWLPVVVDCEAWYPRPERPQRDVPVVVHTPSRAAIKGSTFVDAAAQPLADAGLIEYRRIEGVPPEQMPEVLGDADVVLDQFAIASYGVLACQAMACGLAVVGHVSADVRDAVHEASGAALPVVEATPETLQDVLRELVEDPQRRLAAASAGPAFVREVHDGTRSARVLAEALGVRPPA